MPTLTRRETHVIIILVVSTILLMLSGVDQQTLNDYEYPFLVFYVLPLGAYIATDPERIDKSNH